MVHLFKVVGVLTEIEVTPVEKSSVGKDKTGQ